MKIIVHTTFDTISKDYADYCITITKKLANNVDNITHTMTKVRDGSGGGGHGEALNEIFEAMPIQDDVINVICDSDTILVKQGWDEIILKHMCENSINVVGTTYEDVGGFSSGNSHTQTFKDKPHAIWCAVDHVATEALKHVNMLPDLSPLKITDESTSKTFGIPVGYQLLRDTGWGFATIFSSEEIKYTCMKIIRGNEKKVLRNNNDYNEEYHLDGQPFVCHQRGSRKNKFRQTEISRNFYELCDQYISSQPILK